MTEPLSLCVRCDAADMVDAVIAHLCEQNPALSVDDCVDAIFAVGLMAVASTINLTKKEES